MKAFIAYKYSDFNSPNFNMVRFKKVLSFFNPDFELLSLEKFNLIKFPFIWRGIADYKIRKSSIVFYIEGEQFSNNVFWELKRANRSHKKIIKINFNDEKKLFPIYEKIISILEADENFKDNIKHVNLFSILILHPVTVNKLNTYFEELNLAEKISTTNFRDPILNALEKIEVQQQTLKIPSNKKLKEIKDIEESNIYNFQANIKQQKERNYDLFNLELSKLEEKEKANVLLEQYKVFIQSSETLMARRQSVNSFYLTINTALIAIFGALISLKLEKDLVIVIATLLCLIGMVTSSAWRTMLTSYGVLNKSKIKVISLIEAQLPVALYDAEWHVMTNVAMEETYKPFTKTESLTASTFFYLYLLMFAGSLYYNLFHGVLKVF